MGGAVESVVDFVGDTVESVGNVVQDVIIDPISDIGSDIDDFVNEEIPGGWITVAAATTGAYLGPEAFASTTVADSAAASAAAAGTAEAATAAASAAGAAEVGAGVAQVFPVLAGDSAIVSAIPAAGITAGTTAAAGTLGTGLSTAGLGTLETTAGMQGLFGAGETLTGAGLGLTAPTAPALAAMGGGTGLLTEAAGGGVLGATGVTPAGYAGSILGTTPEGLSINSLGQVLNQAGQAVRQLSMTEIGQMLGSAGQAAVISNAQQQNAAQLRQLGAQTYEQAQQIGAGANVPFTPYTVTTGLGTSQVTPTGATATTAPAYQALQQQALGLSGQTLGAINPAQAAQTLYGQLESLASPARQREQEALMSKLQARGLLGFGQAAPTVGGVTRTVNPLFESLISAQAQQQAQQALAAQQFGTSEALRQQQLAQGLQTQAMGIDEATRQQLATAGTLGINLTQLAQSGAARQAQAQLAGLGLQSQLNLGAADIDAARRAAIAQAVSGQIGSMTQPNPATGTIGSLFAAAVPSLVSNIGAAAPTYVPSVYEANMGVNFLAPGLFG